MPLPTRIPPLWLLAMLTFSGTLAMHIFVPALPIAAADLGVSVSAMQMTISLYILGLAFGQLIYGPLSDRFGRRPVLMAGLALYTLAGLAAGLAPGVQGLIAARLFQALGGCAGLVLARAIVRDTAAQGEAARRLALMNLMVTVGPGLAPLIGTLLAEHLGWRSIFVALCALGLGCALLTWKMLPETGVTAHVSLPVLARNYGQLLKSAKFLGLAIGGGCATTSMYAFVATAPFIFVHQLSRPTYEVGIYLALLMAGASAGSMLASRLIPRFSLQRLLIIFNGIGVAACFVFLIGVSLGHLSVGLTVGAMLVFTTSAAIASPAALTQAISVNPLVIGSASGLYGFTQMVVGAICTSLAGLGDNPALMAGIVMAGAGIVAQLSFWVALKGKMPA